MSEIQITAPPFLPSASWDTIKRLAFSALLFCAFFALCVRGIFEVTIGKLLAYVLQVGLWTLVQFIALTMFRYRPTGLLSAGAALTFFFGVTA